MSYNYPNGVDMNLVFSKKIVALAGGVFLFAANFAFSQSSQKSDGTTLPSISMPEMPSVSMPSIGSGFYTPGRSDFYNPNLKRNQKNQSAVSSTNSPTSPSAPSNPQATASSQTATFSQQNALENAKNLNSLAQSTSSTLNKLSAEDISSLSNLGVFNQISGLLGRTNSNLESKLLEAQQTVTANTADSATLQQILTELTELKNQVNGTGGEKVSLSDKSKAGETFSNVIKKEPKILRFVVNGYDLLSTCKKIYFSDTETDGTFLLTGDRKYMSENKARSETFYFYFRAKGSENGITKYAVTPAVSQDYENEYSYLYQLTQKSELTADRTGNLITLRVTDGDWKMDLLISLDR